MKNLAEMVVEWLDNEQYQELFTRACCFHFAVIAHRREIGSLWFTESKVDKCFKAHVFVIAADGRGFDVNGYKNVPELLHPVAAWSQMDPLPTTLAEVERDIASIGFCEALNERVFRAAEKTIARITEQGAPATP